MKIRRVKKRDGREVPFDKAKIAEAVGKAQSAVGEEDSLFAGEVADVVELALRRRYALDVSNDTSSIETIPDIEEIQDLVEQALIELGHAAVAKAYILYRDRRARIRAALEVRGEGQAERARRAPRVQISGGVAEWSKGRIVGALMNEGDLPRATAEQVAARVEERVFDSGLKRISTALIRELVDNELVELGLAQALRRQRPVGLPRHDLRRLFEDPRALDEAGTPRAAAREPTLADALARAVLSRYCLEDVLSDALGEAHLSGEIQVEDLGRPELPLCASVPCELLLRGEPLPRSAFAALEEIGALVRGTSHCLVLDDAAPLVQALLRGARQSAERPAAGGVALGHWLCALAALGQASGREIDLVLAPMGSAARAEERAGARAPAWLERLLSEFDELEREGSLARGVRIFAESEDLLAAASGDGALSRALERLLALERVVPTFATQAERCAGMGLARGPRERGALALGGVVALNLPRLARRVGPWREDAFFEALASAVETALAALEELRRFQRLEQSGARAGRPRSRISYAVTPVGLREALRWLGDGELRPEQGARVLSFLCEALDRFGEARGLCAVLTPFFGERAAERFAVQDEELFVRQPLLFDASPARAERGQAYSQGFDLGPLEPGPTPAFSQQGAGEAALLSVLRSGALHPLRALLCAGGSDVRGERTPRLERLAELERMRVRLRAGAHALYVLPPTPTPGHALASLAPAAALPFTASPPSAALPLIAVEEI